MATTGSNQVEKQEREMLKKSILTPVKRNLFWYGMGGDEWKKDCQLCCLNSKNPSIYRTRKTMIEMLK